jgi:nitrogenase molybdenum-iron protein alpha/beta subunit
MQKKHMGRSTSKFKTISPTRKVSSKFKLSPANSSNAAKIVINVRTPGPRGSGVEGEEAMEEEVVTYLILSEEEHKVDRKPSEMMSPKKSKKSGTFLTQDEGMYGIEGGVNEVRICIRV